MNKILIKWGALCTIGAFLITFSLISISRGNYNLIVIYLFLGIFLVYASLKKISLLIKAIKALKEARTEITIYYRDRNQVESTNTVIPVSADMLYFYGFLPEKNDIKTFRWEGIWRALDNDKELEREEIQKRVSD